jgi:hypothetical protein
MPAYQGTYFAKTFILQDATTEEPIDITGWEFRAMLRDNLDDEEAALELTTDNGGFEIVSAEDGSFQMIITADQTADLDIARYLFDVIRTDHADGPIYLFGGKFNVRMPVTRDD